MGIYPPPKLGQLRRRDVPEGLISDMRGVSARCLFLPLADIGWVRPVSKAVNTPAVDEPGLIEPIVLEPTTPGGGNGVPRQAS